MNAFVLIMGLLTGDVSPEAVEQHEVQRTQVARVGLHIITFEGEEWNSPFQEKMVYFN